MNDQAVIEASLEEYKDLTIREYSLKTGIPEPTVRSRIRAGKLSTVIINVDGNDQRGIRVPVSPSNDNQQLPLNNLASSNKSLPTINQSSSIDQVDYRLIIGDRDERIKELKAKVNDDESIIKEQSDIIKELEKKLNQAYINLARLTEAAKSKDQIITAKDETILSNKALVFKMQSDENERNPALETMSTHPDQPRQEAPQATNRPGWMVGLGRLLTGQ